MAAIRESQTAEGTWSTDYTPEPSYSGVERQSDVWAPAILVDVLEPVAESADLGTTVARARTFLEDQIELDGLVRYEGKGSALLPDSDDTALLWRIAPGDVAGRIEGVLRVLDEYRADNGLYRIWLSPGGRIGHPAVGDDPNPTDIVTQVHVLQLLSVYAPDEAARLCSALATHVADRGLWTYSEMSPWLYVVREIDLQALGCTLPRPEPLLRTELDHQVVYMDLVRLLRDLVLAEGPTPSREDVLDVLTLVSADDFEHVDRTPLLLYHNDLTSSVSRFYWSKDLAYALWIRLYFEAERRFANWPDASSTR